jgi:adenylate cyclase
MPVAESVISKRDSLSRNTINTASRIQSVCNTYGKSFLISEDLKNEIENGGKFTAEFVTTIKLKGKEKEISLYNVKRLVSLGFLFCVYGKSVTPFQNHFFFLKK